VIVTNILISVNDRKKNCKGPLYNDKHNIYGSICSLNKIHPLWEGWLVLKVVDGNDYELFVISIFVLE
jgi:hypothetical protein